MTAPTPPDTGIGVYQGARAPNPRTLYGQDDLVTVPTVYPRFMSPWGMLQLSNGIDRGDYGKRDASPAASYLSAVAAIQPGQTRLSGKNLADFPMQGASYQQWQVYVQSTAGSESSYNGGPGVIAANGIVNPGSGA